MFLLSLARIFRFAFQSFLRNIWLSLVTITIIVMTVFSLTVLILVNVLTDQAVSSIKNKVDISLYFEAQTKEETVTDIKDQISKIDHVRDIEYVSATAALERFKATHSQDSLIQDAVDEMGENPLGPVLVVKADEMSNYPSILKNIEDFKINEVAKEIDYDDHQLIIQKIELISGKIKQFGLFLSIAFTLISLLVVFNTIRVGIYVHRDEVNIMKLVGASNWFIRGPFLVESILYAVFGCLVFWIIFYVAIGFINPIVSGFFADINFNLISYVLHNFWYIFGFELVAMVLLNIISSAFALGRHLKV
ncbi:MAG TPA: permease-like cell division protein FtsX [bacterium]|nr:permease-like cell division protein FtsX [bacterium]